VCFFVDPGGVPGDRRALGEKVYKIFIDRRERSGYNMLEIIGKSAGGGDRKD